MTTHDDDDDDVVDGEIVYITKCHHVFEKSGRSCKANAIDGYSLCQKHITQATIRDIRLARGNTVSFEEIRGRLVENPLEELAELVSEVLLYKDYSARRVADLRGQERYEGRAGEQLRAEVALYERSLDRAGKMLVDWSRLNIDDRLARIEEKKAQLIIDIIRGALRNAEGLTDDGRKSVEAYVVKELRAASKTT